MGCAAGGVALRVFGADAEGWLVVMWCWGGGGRNGFEVFVFVVVGV